MPSFAYASAESSSTSTDLLRRVQANEGDAWRRLVELYGPLVWHWCRQADLDAHDRADVFQLVFQAVLRRIGDFRREAAGGTFRGWLLVITQNQVRDHFRRRHRQANAAGGTDAHRRWLALENPDADESRTTSGAHPVTQLVRQTLAAIRNDFEPQTWQAFWQTAVESRSSAEVARELRMTSGAVRKAKARVLARLRAELGDSV